MDRQLLSIWLMDNSSFIPLTWGQVIIHNSDRIAELPVEKLSLSHLSLIGKSGFSEGQLVKMVFKSSYLGEPMLLLGIVSQAPLSSGGTTVVRITGINARSRRLLEGLLRQEADQVA